MSGSTPGLPAAPIPLADSPGHGNLVFAANGARFGVRATVTASAGHHPAPWVATAAIGFDGAGTVGESAPEPRDHPAGRLRPCP